MTNYLYYDYTKSSVSKVKDNKIEYEKASSIKSYLNHECLKNGASFEGRKSSFLFLTNKKKYASILIKSEPLSIYFPIKSTKAYDCIWVNWGQIDHVDYKKKTCTIYFKDHTCLNCSYPQRIKDNIHVTYRYLIKIKLYSHPPLQPLQP